MPSEYATSLNQTKAKEYSKIISLFRHSGLPFSVGLHRRMNDPESLPPESWIPASAGMTEKDILYAPSRFFRSASRRLAMGEADQYGRNR